ncbi:MAG: ABC transporter ATP-binding protein [Phycisphaerales bacterium]|jgi:putative ABC transport system ATP-binding protein|nr:ABC transporter ATP-binding protein [Phycisphaerales bacterium]MBT7172027.1 ABC transporter ATP-binding protein [Phycisphaerales bacterium]
MTLIECKNLTRTYRKAGRSGAEVTPLREMNLNVDQGSFLALMGPSGSGKTTLLNMLAGIDRPTGGELWISGMNIADLSRAALADWRAKSIGYIFQLYNLVPVLTAYENVELPLLLHKLTRAERHERVCTALDLVGLSDRHDHYPRQLSGGQEQRVAIARAIVTDPDIIVADEPTGDLDKAGAVAIMNLLCRLNSEMGKTLIMVTHDPKCADYANQTLHLEKGKLVEAEMLNEDEVIVVHDDEVEICRCEICDCDPCECAPGETEGQA